MKQEFNPQEWIDKANAEQQARKSSNQRSVDGGSSPSVNPSFPPQRINNPSTDLAAEVDTVINRIEANFEDITTSYADWINVGFAFAHEFGEAGRKNFHRVSRYYNGYTKAETNKQYDNCLKSQGHGITIKTFFHLAKQAGIDINTNEARREGEGEMGRRSDQCSVGSCSNPLVDSNQCSVDSSILPSDEHSSSEEEEQLPTLPDYLFGQLPDFFKRVVERADSKEERDMLLLASIVALGSGLTTFSGIYDGNQVFPTLFFYIAARASSGKGRLVMCRNLVDPIHWEKRKQSAQENLVYEVEMREYNLIKSKDVAAEKPPKPPVRLHILPANNTTAGLLQLLADNNGEGLIIETEGDTMAKALKSEISDFSDFLRKDYHHEMISAYRKTDHEYQNIEQPRFNMILSSTFGQLRSLIPSTENGLLSRFMFYYMNLKPIWKDVFEHSNKKPLADHFNELGQEFFHLYTTLRAKDPIRFALREDQQKEFNAFFARMQDKYLVLQGMDYVAIIRRLGLMAFRIMMILTAMRIPETGDFSTCQQCNDEDFQTSLSIIKVMVLHASYIVSQLPTEEKTEKRGNKKSKFYEGLGERFTTKDFVELAKGFSIPERTAKRYVALFCDKHLICREDTGIYSKSNQKEQQRY